MYIVKLITLRLYIYVYSKISNPKIRYSRLCFVLYNVYLRLKNFPKVLRVIPHQMVKNVLGLDRPVSKFDANLRSCCSI